MKRHARHAVACAAALALIPSADADAQPSRSPFFARTPAFGGADVFLAPHASGSLGPLDIGGQLELGWGPSSAKRGAGSVAFEPIDGLRLSASLEAGSASADGRTGSEHTIRLALDGRRLGIAAAHRTAETRLDGRASALHATELRAWTGLGGRVDVGVSLRTGTGAERGDHVEERTYVVAGYEFVATDRIGYTFIASRRDLEADVTLQLGSFRLTGVAGRAFVDGVASARSWAYGRLAAPLPHGLELLLEAGRTDGGTPVAPEPSRFARLGLRVDLGRAGTGAPVRDSGTSPTPHGAASALLEVSDGAPRLIVTAPDARGVEVKGDFTAWEPRSMSPIGDGRWMVPLRTGVVRFNIRIEGDSWTVPAGVPVVADEFSGAPVAVVVVR